MQKTKKLAKEIIDAMKEGRVKIVGIRVNIENGSIQKIYFDEFLK